MTFRGLLTSTFLLVLQLPFAASAAAQDRLAITSVNVVNVADGSLSPDQTVLLEGDRIVSVDHADEVEVPLGSVVIDGRGKYLIPGLWDMHAHTSSDWITREVLYPLFVAHGVTGIRNMMADCFETEPQACGPVETSIEEVQARRQAMAEGSLIGPRVVAASVPADGSAEGSSVQAPATPADARAFVRLAKARGVDFIKVYDMIPRDAYFALADEARRQGIPFAGHTPVAVRASEASDSGQRSIEHLGHGNVLDECSAREEQIRPRLIAEIQSDQPEVLPLMLEMVETHDPAKCAGVAERFVRNGTWVVPTLMVMRLPEEIGAGWRADPYVRFLPPEELRFFEQQEEADARVLGTAAEAAPHARWAREITGRMHRAGVRMLAGSDCGTPGVFCGIGLHQELELLVSAGLTAAEALRAATLGPAEYLEATDSLGTVEAGKAADLVLLEANPLDDIRNTQNIEAVVLRGRYLDRKALDSLMAAAERAAAASPAEEPALYQSDTSYDSFTNAVCCRADDSPVADSPSPE